MSSRTIRGQAEARPRERIYQLLPALYRARDLEQGQALRALLLLLEEQLDVIEEDVARLYDNWFIETCDEWVIPYLGDLIGALPLNWAVRGTASQRAYTAHTLSYRRQKGTLSALKRLARHVTQWATSSVESSRHLGRSVHLAATATKTPRLAYLRRGDTLTDLGGALLRAAHTLDIRGRHAPKDATLFLWRLRTDPLQRVRPAPVGDQPRAFRVSPLGQDLGLWRPLWPSYESPEVESALPIALSNRELERLFEERRRALAAGQKPPAALDKAPPLRIYLGGVEVPLEQIVVSDLAAFTPPPDHLDYGTAQAPVAMPIKAALDAQRGRLVFAADVTAPVEVSFAEALCGELGGGSYSRVLRSDRTATLFRASAGTLAWPTLSESQRVIIEIGDSHTYAPTDLILPGGVDLELRAESGCRPLLRCDNWTVTMSEGATLRLSGLLIAGGLQLAAPVLPAGASRGATLNVDRFNEFWGQRSPAAALHVEHCTLVPGLGLTADGAPISPTAPNLTVRGLFRELKLALSRVITGPLVLPKSDTQISISDSIIDALDESALALRADRATILRSTVRGAVELHLLDRAQDSLLCGALRVELSDSGLVSYSFVDEGTTMLLERCQPQLALSRASTSSDEPLMVLRARVRPTFTSTRYAAPGYFQLAQSCAEEISHGGSDESEMGAFHHLYQPLRDANLRSAAGEHAGLSSRVLLRYRT